MLQHGSSVPVLSGRMIWTVQILSIPSRPTGNKDNGWPEQTSPLQCQLWLKSARRCWTVEVPEWPSTVNQSCEKYLLWFTLKLLIFFGNYAIHMLTNSFMLVMHCSAGVSNKNFSSNQLWRTKFPHCNTVNCNRCHGTSGSCFLFLFLWLLSDSMPNLVFQEY